MATKVTKTERIIVTVHNGDMQTVEDVTRALNNAGFESENPVISDATRAGAGSLPDMSPRFSRKKEVESAPSLLN